MVIVELTLYEIASAIQEYRFGRGGAVYCDLLDGSRWQVDNVIKRDNHVYVLCIVGG